MMKNRKKFDFKVTVLTGMIVGSFFLLTSCGKGLNNYNSLNANSSLSALAGPSTAAKNASIYRKSGFLALNWLEQLFTLMVPNAYTGSGPANGFWYVTPDKITFTITDISLTDGTTSGTQITFPNGGCVVTWDNTMQSLASLANCPLTIKPGTYTKLIVNYSTSFGFLINDTTNNIYTDPSKSTLLNTSAPAGGASMVTFTPSTTSKSTNSAYGSTALLSPPLVVAATQTGSSAAPSIYFVIDAIHSIPITVTGSDIEFFFGQTPIDGIPTVTAGKATHYSSINSSASVSVGSSGQPIEVSFLYTDQKTLAAVNEGTVVKMTNCPMGGGSPYMIDTNPAGQTIDNLGFRYGGFAGASGGFVGFAEGSDKAYSSYYAYYKMAEATTLGSSSTLQCQLNSAVTVPVPSDNVSYNSGVPAITTVSDSTTMFLVGD